MKSKKLIAWSVIALFALPVLEVSAGVGFQLLSTFDYPGDVLSTQPQKITSNREVVGVYTDLSGLQHGFIRYHDGSFSAPLTDPNDTGGITQGRGINGSLLVCGDYLDGAYHGFFYDGGVFTNYDVPGSSWTILLGLNNAGDFCGSDIPGSGVQSGFVSVGGVVTEFTFPGSTATLDYQINATNQSCGYYLDSSGVSHGYYRDSDGSLFGPIDPAGSTGTIVFGNNNKNWIVGRYPDSSGLTHGYLFIAPRRYYTYDYPGSTFTSFNGITTGGLIVGRYLDNSGIEHGLLVQVVKTASDNSISGTMPVRQSSTAINIPRSLLRLEEPAH
jgi:hypothetical protein